MEIANYLQLLLFILCVLGGVAILIFALRKDQGYDYDKIIRELNAQKEENLNTLDIRNKEIDKIESKILECKKELGIKLFDK